jgi:hypothetical protein
MTGPSTPGAPTMTFKIVQRTQVAGSYGVTPFDDASIEIIR